MGVMFLDLHDAIIHLRVDDMLGEIPNCEMKSMKSVTVWLSSEHVFRIVVDKIKIRIKTCYSFTTSINLKLAKELQSLPGVRRVDTKKKTIWHLKASNVPVATTPGLLPLVIFSPSFAPSATINNHPTRVCHDPI